MITSVITLFNNVFDCSQLHICQTITLIFTVFTPNNEKTIKTCIRWHAFKWYLEKIREMSPGLILISETSLSVLKQFFFCFLLMLRSDTRGCKCKTYFSCSANIVTRQKVKINVDLMNQSKHLKLPEHFDKAVKEGQKKGLTTNCKKT